VPMCATGELRPG